MISKINICNLALAHLGQSPISSLDQTDERAKRLNLFYEPVRDEVLRTHNWGFAAVQKKLELARQDAQTGEFLYHYPADALYVRRIFLPGQKQLFPFEMRYDTVINGRVLAAKVPGGYALYTRRVEDESQFDGAFVKAFTLALAYDMAITLTADRALAAHIFEKYTLCLDEARRSNMTENYQRPQAQDAFSEVR